MPIEVTLLKDVPVPLATCSKCGKPFEPFLRGSIQRSKRSWFGRKRDYCTLICSHCKLIVGHESPPGWMNATKN